MNSYEVFLDSLVLTELSKFYTFEFTDKMFAHLPYYTSAETVLTKNGYMLEGDAKGFTLSKGKTATTVELKAFSAPFLNMWVQDSGITGVSGIPINFACGFPAERGLLSAFSPEMEAFCKENGLTPAQGDASAVEFFVSNEVTKDGKNSIYTYHDAEVSSMAEFMDMGTMEIIFTDKDEAGKDEPFYYKIEMTQRKKPLKEIPKPWLKKIEEDGLSYEFEDGFLFVANTVGAARGLPPAPAHLRLKPLELTFDNWNTVKSEKKIQPSKTVVKGKEENVSDSDAEVSYAEAEEMLDQFLADPSKTTHDAMITAKNVKELFANENRNPNYKMGTNKYSQVSMVRELMVGVKKAVDWSTYAANVEEHANPSDSIGKIIIFKRLAGALRTHKGQVYCIENTN